MQQPSKYLCLFLLLCVASSCSTRKSTFFTRAFHNTTTHYNWYFNGEEAIKTSVKKLKNKHEDNYNSLLQIYPLGTERDAQSVKPKLDKAIKKGATAISRHSILIKGKEHNKWIDDCYLMIAKAYFYQREYVKSIEAFRFISRQFEGTKTDYQAKLWLIRCYINNNDLPSADIIINQLLSDDAFPVELNKQLALNYAEIHIQRGDFYSAIEELQTAEQLSRKKIEKTRYLYILAQLNQELKDYPKASYYYNQVLKKSPDYEMAFNAKINKARVFDVESGDTQAIKEELLEMLSDAKNKEYQDVIYYGLAELSIREGKTNEAISLYQKSVSKSIVNNPQKAISSLEAANLFYNNQKYRQAQAYYDTAVVFLPNNYKTYKQTKNRQETLNSLIENLNIIENQDSLQTIALMSEQDRNQYIDDIISTILEQERIAKEQEMNSRLDNMMFQDQQGTQGLNNRINQTGQSKGGKWYFYNATTLSFGYADFARKWGKRKLEDNWRRSNKSSFSNEELEADSVQEELDPKSRETYLKNLPLTVELLEKSNNLIIEAFYNAGAIYKEELLDYPKSIEMFNTLNERYPQNNNRAMVLYYLYRLNSIIENTTKSKHYKTQLISEFPSSEFAKIISDSTYLEKSTSSISEIENLYSQAHRYYKNENYTDALSICDQANKLHPTNLLKPNFDLLEALSTGGVKGKDQMINRLKLVEEKHKGHQVSNIAKEFLKLLEENKDIEVENKQDSQEQINTYVQSLNSPHYFIILFKKYNLDLNTAKALFSDYHSEFYSFEKLNISSVLMDEQTHMLSVREFESSKKALAYYNAFIKAETSLPFGEEYNSFIIAAKNFPKFFKNKDLDGYDKFFSETYLKKD